MKPTDPPRPTGKPPEDVLLLGMLIPWGADDQPCVVGISGPQIKLAVPLFENESQLRIAAEAFGLDVACVKQVTDGQQFQRDIPSDLEIIINPRREPARGTIIYTKVLRD